MSRIKKVIGNIFLIVILSFFIIRSFGLYLTPLSAHEHSERGIHYGPSEVIHIEDFDDGKYILGKYDKWVSCNTVKRVWLFFWSTGEQPIGFENDKAKAVSYTWSAAYENYKVYGIINDTSIKRIDITLSNGEIITQTDFYDDLFLITWKSKRIDKKYFKSIIGYDSENNTVFKEEY